MEKQEEILQTAWVLDYSDPEGKATKQANRRSFWSILAVRPGAARGALDILFLLEYLLRGSRVNTEFKVEIIKMETWEVGGEMQNFPDCQKCSVGVLLPLSDYGRDGSSILYKAWVCSNPNCGFSIRIDNGEISLGRTIGHSAK